jgi:hypothetical protein
MIARNPGSQESRASKEFPPTIRSGRSPVIGPAVRVSVRSPRPFRAVDVRRSGPRLPTNHLQFSSVRDEGAQPTNGLVDNQRVHRPGALMIDRPKCGKCRKAESERARMGADSE